MEEWESDFRLSIIEPARYISKSRKSYPGYLCQCKCGNTKIVKKSDFLNQKVKSCGCLVREFNRGKIGNNYGSFKRSNNNSQNKLPKYKRLHSIWKNMKQRCLNQNFPKYKDYGERGISVCSEWAGKNGFMNFYHWAMNNGYSDELTLDRKDNDKGYSPDNCRWVNDEVQRSNKRTNVYISYGGVTKTVAQWAKILCATPECLHYRIKNGLPNENVLLGVKEKDAERNLKVLNNYLNQ